MPLKVHTSETSCTIIRDWNLLYCLITAASPAITQLQEGATAGNEPSQILQLNKLLRLDNNKFCFWKWPLGLPTAATNAGRTWGQGALWLLSGLGITEIKPEDSNEFVLWRMHWLEGFIKAQHYFVLELGLQPWGWAWAGWASQQHPSGSPTSVNHWAD